jgi:hypothetical protein
LRCHVVAVQSECTTIGVVLRFRSIARKRGTSRRDFSFATSAACAAVPILALEACSLLRNCGSRMPLHKLSVATFLASLVGRLDGQSPCVDPVTERSLEPIIEAIGPEGFGFDTPYGRMVISPCRAIVTQPNVACPSTALCCINVNTTGWTSCGSAPRWLRHGEVRSVCSSIAALQLYNHPAQVSLTLRCSGPAAPLLVLLVAGHAGSCGAGDYRRWNLYQHSAQKPAGSLPARSPARRSPPSTPGAADSLRCYDTRGRCRRQRSRLSATMRPPAQDSPSPQSSLPASCTVRACSTSRGGQIWSAGHPCRRLLRRRLSATARVCLGAGASTFCACITHHYKQQ